MYDTILVPTDGSDVAATAGAAAVDFATRFDATVWAVHVLDRAAAGDDRERRADQAIRVVDDLADEAGVPVSTEVVDAEGPVHRAITATADRHGADLVAMGTHGRTGLDRFVLGSVTERTLRQSPVPVLTVHEGTGVALDDCDVLLPTDGSEPSAAAVEHAVAFADAADARFHVVNAVEPAAIQGGTGAVAALDALKESGEATVGETVDRAGAAGVDVVEAAVRTGPPHRVILEYAVANDVDLITMGTHGLTGLDRFLVGSVTERVVRLADVPVIAVEGPSGE